MFLVYLNSKGMSSRHVYDGSSGRGIGDVLVREGEYRLAFPEDLTDEAIRLNPANRYQARNDSDFKNLADDPRFTELLYPDTSTETAVEPDKWHY